MPDAGCRMPLFKYWLQSAHNLELVFSPGAKGMQATIFFKGTGDLDFRATWISWRSGSMGQFSRICDTQTKF